MSARASPKTTLCLCSFNIRIVACIRGFVAGNEKTLVERVVLQRSTDAHSMSTLSMGKPALYQRAILRSSYAINGNPTGMRRRRQAKYSPYGVAIRTATLVTNRTTALQVCV